jgi:hypothetical protein
MSNQEEPAAKPTAGSLVEYVCPPCGGWDQLCAVFSAFLPFIDHLIDDLFCVQHGKRGRLFVSESRVWYRDTEKNQLIAGLPPYRPDAREWKQLLEKCQKILPQAKVFLLDVADWLEKALSSVEGLEALRTSDLLTVEELARLIQTLSSAYGEQRVYLLGYPERLEQTGTDPKWLARPGRQAGFVARSMAGARWDLSPSSSREMLRLMERNPRGKILRTLKIEGERFWWDEEGKA